MNWRRELSRPSVVPMLIAAGFILSAFGGRCYGIAKVMW